MKLPAAVVMLLLLIGLAFVAGPAARPFGIDDRLPVTAYLNMPRSAPLGLGAWQVVRAFPNLTFQNPVFFSGAPNSNRLYVCEREGRIWSFANDQNATEKTLVLDLSAKTQGWDDCGMLAFVFHPEFGKPGSPNRGYFYVWHNRTDTPTQGGGRPPTDKITRDRLSRYTIPDGQLIADPKSETMLIDQEDRNVWHNGGGMFFGPDGFLYLSLGDEGGTGDQYGNSQRVDRSLFSGAIRIDVDCDPEKSHPIRRQPERGQTANYFIPNDNPWSGRPDTLEEFFCIGLRNPHRMTMDPVTRQIWAGDVGQDSYEEINKIEAGHNYQWARREGMHDFQAAPTTTTRPSGPPLGVDTPPYYEYPRNNGDTCIIGGYVYRGKEHADLIGKYVFADNTSGRIYSIETDAQHPQPTLLANMPRRGYGGISSFGVDNDNELYMCQLGDHDGQLFKLSRPQTVVVTHLPQTLSQTGAFSDVKTLSPAAGLTPYDVNSPLWSDRAAKSRWIALPANSAIGFKPTGSWEFPDGTVFVKHFELPLDERDPKKVRRLETRLLVRDDKGGAYGATYRWRNDESDADLLTTAAVTDLTIATDTAFGHLQSGDVGKPAIAGKTTPIDASSFDLSAGGTDVYGTADEFHYASQIRKGDFDVRVRIDAVSAASSYTKAGLMARQTLDAGSRYVFAFAYEGNVNPPNGQGFDMQMRDEAGGEARSMHPQVKNAFPNAWVRLKRQRNDFSAYASSDGLNWTPLGTQSIAMPETVFLGLALTAHDAQKPATAKFRDLSNLRAQQWYFPSPQDCLACHTELSGHVLGVNARQLNGTHRYPGGVSDNQLRTWAHLKMFNNPPKESALADIPRLVPLTDDTAPLLDRVRSYLDSNCAQCHLPGGATGTFDARFETPFEQQRLINSEVRNTANVRNGRTIIPGDPSRSIIFRRMNTDNHTKMPPLARNVRDRAAIQVMREWIQSLPKPPAQGQQ